MMALEQNMIGIAATNSVRYGAPTYGRGIMLGTNPLAFAIPADKEPAFVFDFATTTVPRGKLEVYKRKEKPLNEGWAIDDEGHPTTSADAALRGALLPLGGSASKTAAIRVLVSVFSLIFCAVFYQAVHSLTVCRHQIVRRKPAQFRISSAHSASTDFATLPNLERIWIARYAI